MSSARPLPPRDTRGPTPIGQCASIAALSAQARARDRLSRRIIPLLPAPLRDHVQHAGLHHDRLLLLVESPVWATRVRLDQYRILAAVRAAGIAVAAVASKTVPHLAPGLDNAPRPRAPNAAPPWRAVATACRDPELRALFLEMAERSEGPTRP